MLRIEVEINYAKHTVYVHCDGIEEAELLAAHESWECSYRDADVTIWINCYDDTKLISKRKFDC